jgi:hypothetical protein
MLRSFITALLPVTLFLAIPAPTSAQWEPPAPRRWGRTDIAGRYVFENGGNCSVSRRRDGYLFINERGSRAIFAWSGPRQLQLVSTEGGWDPNMVATVSLDRRGRTVIAFDAPGNPTSYWTRVS